MEKVGKVGYIFTVFFVSLAGLFFVADDQRIVLYCSVVVISGLLFAFLQTGPGFIVLLFNILVFGFGLTIWSYNENFTSWEQYFLVTEHIVLTINLILLWLLFSRLKQIEAGYYKLQKLVKELQKYDSQLSILTITEFISRAKLILTGMKRRSETGFLVQIDIVDEGLPHTLESVSMAVSKAFLQSIRTEYDLVGQLAENKLLLLLQNTSLEGCDIVINRMEEALSQDVTSQAKKAYTIHIQVLNDEGLLNLETKVRSL